MDALTLDQLPVFVAVADTGSFSRAAKALQRAQSVITYAIQKLEGQVGVTLFDRSAYRPMLTEAGQALLVRARRVTEEAASFRDQAHSLASGLEPELSIALDPMFPMPLVVEALRAFGERFPTVPPRVQVGSLGTAAQLVLDGTCVLGMLPSVVTDLTPLRTIPVVVTELIPVAAPCHPLTAMEGPIPAASLHQHVQLVLTDSSVLTTGRDYGVLSSRTWRLADLGTKKSMLLAGLGWGSMPSHMVSEEVARGELKRIEPVGFNPMTARLVLGVAYCIDRSLGPAATWVVERFRVKGSAAT